MDIFEVIISKKAEKQLVKLPSYIVDKLFVWVRQISIHGSLKVRKISSYHDEPLKGERKGQRSIMLNKAYRAIYEIRDGNEIEFIEIVEVNKHDY